MFLKGTTQLLMVTTNSQYPIEGMHFSAILVHFGVWSQNIMIWTRFGPNWSQKPLHILMRVQVFDTCKNHDFHGREGPEIMKNGQNLMV